MKQKNQIKSSQVKLDHIHKFNKPFEYEGKKYDELVFDYGELKGRDMLNAHKVVTATKMFIVAPEFDYDYLIEIAAGAARIDKNMLELLLGPAFNKIMGKTRNFILHGE